MAECLKKLGSAFATSAAHWALAANRFSTALVDAAIGGNDGGRKDDNAA